MIIMILESDIVCAVLHILYRKKLFLVDLLIHINGLIEMYVL